MSNRLQMHEHAVVGDKGFTAAIGHFRINGGGEGGSRHGRGRGRGHGGEVGVDGGVTPSIRF